MFFADFFSLIFIKNSKKSKKLVFFIRRKKCIIHTALCRKAGNCELCIKNYDLVKEDCPQVVVSEN